MKNYLLLLVCVFVLASPLLAQTGEQSGMIKSAKGILVVWNEPGNYYTIEIKGEKIIPAEQPLLFQVDGKFFQIQTVEKKAFLKDPSDKSLDDKAILAAHRDWERDYISKVIKNELKIDSAWVKLSNGNDALAWSYKMPKVVDSQGATKQLYIAVMKRDHVLLVNSALTGDDNEEDTKKLLIGTLITLRSADKPLSLEKARVQVLKDN